MPGRIAGLSRAMRCALLLRATTTLAWWRREAGIPETRRAPGPARPRCCYCGRAVIARAQVGEGWRGLAAATIDHVDPSGPTKPDNLVVACWACNCEKGRRTPGEWRPAWARRVRLQLERPLDIAAGRRLARELYPR